MSDHGNLTNPAPDAARLDRRRGASSIFDASRPGRRGVLLPPLDVPGADPEALFGALHRAEVEGEVEASEVDAVRHFTRLSQKNLSIDANLYPLGSCTMKHNPRINEEIARLAGFADVHPYTPGAPLPGGARADGPPRGGPHRPHRVRARHAPALRRRQRRADRLPDDPRRPREGRRREEVRPRPRLGPRHEPRHAPTSPGTR